jgi:uncharacterized 2Fe-2S/4Fe-4S cluster protein (DUF4445 family)
MLVRIPHAVSMRDELFARGVEFPCGGHGRCRRCKVRVVAGDAPASEEERELLTAAELAAGWRLACRCRPSGAVAVEVAQWESAVLAGGSPFPFEPRDGYGIAVDLGTTTLVAQLLDLRDARVLEVRTALNPQAAYGADVMSRVEFALSPTGRERLRRAVRDAIDALVRGMPQDAAMIIVGNTVMHHLYCGFSLEPLSRAPFDPVNDGAWAEGRARFLPCLGGFVGSDILAGLLATRMHERGELTGLIDIGTNGEIAIGNRDGIVVASTAAGPAFEGGRISCGMRAATGAVSEVNANLQARVIGGVSPRGICGSGLVDAAAAALDLGLIQPGGRIARPIELGGPVRLTQADIRELQLAKAAIAAGARILLAGRRLHTLYLAGAFGNYINRAAARRIGLLKFPLESIDPAGNTALTGAKQALFLPGEDFAFLRRMVRHVPLAASPEFQDAFVEEMAFPTS